MKRSKNKESKNISNVNKGLWVFSALVGMSAFFVYPYLPDLIPTHWGISGQIDAYSDKSMVFLISFLPLALMALFTVIPRIDPKKKSYQLHGKAYEIVVISMIFFMSALYFITTAVALGYNLPVDTFVKLGVALLFIIMGNVLGQVRHNYFFGIRTPWTLANEVVWRKTHRVGAYGFVIAGIFALFSAFLKGMLSFILMFIPLMVLVFYLFIYSYVVFKKIEKQDLESENKDE
jgi:uncharacterized membrane protein